MCSVVGYIGGSKKSREIILDGLTRLEYRGYDSAGIACFDTQSRALRFLKTVGPLRNLSEALQEQPIDGSVGIGHTRWSTHGKSTEDNAHPQFDCHYKSSVVHNGIIENYVQIKQELENMGHQFRSQTDSEAIVHLFEHLFSVYHDINLVMHDLVSKLEGAYAFMIVSEYVPDAIIVARKHSPLCIGKGNDEMFVASDPLAFAGKTNHIFFLPDYSWAIIASNTLAVFTFEGVRVAPDFMPVDMEVAHIECQGYEHFMLKEIYEQKDAIYRTVAALEQYSIEKLWPQLGVTVSYVHMMQSISLLGCGTSWHAARIAQFFFEIVAKIPTSVHLASEYRYMPFFDNHKRWYFFISQSGETADTLEALRMLKMYQTSLSAISNVGSSSLMREVNGGLLTQAGVEVAVASTKAFTTQLVVLYWLAHAIAYERRVITKEQREQASDDLRYAADLLEYAIELNKERITNEYAPFYCRYSKAVFLGRHLSYPFALEAALKLKEIAYIFSQCYPAGELKHGPLALVDADVPVFIFSHQDPVLYKKLISNVQEVKARNGHVIAFAFEGQDELISLADAVVLIPATGESLLGPLIMSGVMQFFVYEIAKKLEREIDKPRNLAKSVTVE